jgi:hypothetical protein
MNDIPAAKIKMMKGSLRCLTLGLLGLLPLIGVPFALAALWASFSARRSERRFWNPAKPQRILGLVCAAFGALLWIWADTILIDHAINSYISS